MVYTVTLNPSLDHILSVENFSLGSTNRALAEDLAVGGKGINVSIVLQNLKVPNKALGFAAGFVGEEILRRMEELGLWADFIRLKKGCSRINVKLKNYDGTEINAPGPEVDEGSYRSIWEKLENIDEDDFLILSGSFPKGVPADFYEEVLCQLKEKKCRILVDAQGEALRSAVKESPFLVKPNCAELGELFGTEITSYTETAGYARRLQQMGARNVLVSMGGKGAVFADETGKVYQAHAPKGRLVNAVGAGDSMVAGFTAGFLEKQDYVYAFRMAVAAGSASAFSEELATEEQIRALYEKVLLQQL